MNSFIEGARQLVSPFCLSGVGSSAPFVCLASRVSVFWRAVADCLQS
ncbi:hypothetical protein LTSEMIN_5951 [Salmonella enterica subsp. enterica serovar Minnesota str. A4-603]|nr:hypothetical protein LTSEMIN_5951 [Salmonella enterica subsp. enterica serovar Minnesota str. A4-603]